MFHSFIAPLWSLEIAGLATWGYLRQAADVRSELVEASFPFPLESAIAEKVTDCILPFLLYCFFCAAFGLLRDINNTSFSAIAQIVTYYFWWSSSISNLKYSAGEIVNNMDIICMP
jgi:hypothetical protein